MASSNRLILAALVAGLAAAAIAGCAEREGVSPTASEWTTQRVPSEPGRIWQQLDLTAEQREKLQAIRKHHRAKMIELRQTVGRDQSRGGMTEARKAIRETMRAELQSILTADQFAAFKRLRAERPAHGGRQGWHGQRLNDGARAERHDRQLNRLTELLALSAAQQEQIRGAVAAIGPHGDAVAREDRIASRSERRAEFERRLKAILTAEQFQTFLGIRAERGWKQHSGRSSN